MRTGLATMTVDAVDHWIGRLPGRLSISAVGGGTLFGALSGASMASVAMLGSTLVPEMSKRNYKPVMSVGSILAGRRACRADSAQCAGRAFGRAGQGLDCQAAACRNPAGVASWRPCTSPTFSLRAKLQPELAPPYVAPPTSLAGEAHHPCSEGLAHVQPDPGGHGLYFFGHCDARRNPRRWAWWRRSSWQPATAA